MTIECNILTFYCSTLNIDGLGATIDSQCATVEGLNGISIVIVLLSIVCVIFEIIYIFK